MLTFVPSLAEKFTDTCFKDLKISSVTGVPRNTKDDHTCHSRNENYLAELVVSLKHALRESKQPKNKNETKLVKKECRKKLSLRGMAQIKTEREEVSFLKKNWTEALSDDFRRLGTMVEFVNAVKADTPRKRKGINFSQLQKHLERALCYTEVLLRCNKIAFVNSVSAAVVPRMYKNYTDEARRDRRNCLIFRDIHAILEDMLKYYTI